MHPSPSTSSSQSLGSYLWNSLPRRAMQSGIFSGVLAAGETFLICTYTPNIAVDAVQYLATTILISSALVVCHSLGDKKTSYKDALKEPLIQGRVILLKAQGFLSKEVPVDASSFSSSERSEQISLDKIPKELAKVAFQTLKGATRALEFFGAREEAVSIGLAFGGTTYLLLEDEQMSALLAGGGAAFAGAVFFPTPLPLENSGESSVQGLVPANPDSVSEEKGEEK